jgi:hypothetical protein
MAPCPIDPTLWCLTAVAIMRQCLERTVDCIMDRTAERAGTHGNRSYRSPGFPRSRGRSLWRVTTARVHKRVSLRRHKTTRVPGEERRFRGLVAAFGRHHVSRLVHSIAPVHDTRAGSFAHGRNRAMALAVAYGLQHTGNGFFCIRRQGRMRSICVHGVHDEVVSGAREGAGRRECGVVLQAHQTCRVAAHAMLSVPVRGES